MPHTILHKSEGTLSLVPKPKLDIITDPLTKKQFFRDTSIPGSTYQAYTGQGGQTGETAPSDVASQPIPNIVPQPIQEDPLTKFNNMVFNLLQGAKAGQLSQKSGLEELETANAMAPAKDLGIEGLTPSDMLSARKNLSGQYNPAISNINDRVQLFDSVLQHAKSLGETYFKNLPATEKDAEPFRDFLRNGGKLSEEAIQKYGKFFTMDDWAANLAATKGEKKLDTSVVDIGGRKVLIDNQTGKTIKDLGTSTGTSIKYVPGSNPTVDNWAKLIIAGQASITQVPNPRGSTLRSDVVDAITNSGQLLLSDKDREKLNVLDTAFNVYDTIKGLSEKINTFDVVGRVTGYLGRYLGGATQYDVDIARYNAARQGFVANVARTLGEKGTLAEGDVQRAINNLPTINDTEAVAEGKLETLKSILDGAKASIIQKSTEPLTKTTSGTLNTTSGQTSSGLKYTIEP